MPNEAPAKITKEVSTRSNNANIKKPKTMLKTSLLFSLSLLKPSFSELIPTTKNRIEITTTKITASGKKKKSKSNEA